MLRLRCSAQSLARLRSASQSTPIRLLAVQTRPSIEPSRLFHLCGQNIVVATLSTAEDLEVSVSRFIESYRNHGHLLATLDPLGRQSPAAMDLQLLEPATYNTSLVADAALPAAAAKATGLNTVSQLHRRLAAVYSGAIGYELAHLPPTERQWLIQKIESLHEASLAVEEQRRIAELLLKSEVFDGFMQKRFAQVKRYGLEGAESMLVAIDSLLQHLRNVDNVVIAMPHRGRLNLLIDLLQYPPEAIFRKLKGYSELPEGIPGTADVLSHLAYQGALPIGASKGLVTLLPNSSHLEAVNPVGMGCAYALAIKSEKPSSSLCLQIHGDAAFTGQGVVMETLALSQLPDFGISGSIHLIVNNQLGFTTSPKNGRSTRYCSDPAKMIGAPIFHVNGHAPEQVAKAMRLAAEYRETFKKDVVVDLMGYRKMGHNELDEPAFTQPLMYKAIRAHDSVGKAYSELMTSRGGMTSEEVLKVQEDEFARLDAALKQCEMHQPKLFALQKDWELAYDSAKKCDTETGVGIDILRQVGKQSVAIPDAMVIHQRLSKFHVEQRLTALELGEKLDWASAEALAVGTLLREGKTVRISGQDVGRGTFSQRHFIFADQETNSPFTPFSGLANKHHRAFQVVNSNLSELAVLGFEYGLSIGAGKNVLPIWEAQFGDFFNGAQVMLDAFIGSGETKWGLQSGLVLLLPHGYDGAGPEHSSCRLERFLQMCDTPMAETDANSGSVNWQVANPTTPAQYFHLLRRQLARNYRKPLVVAAPKTLLRLPAAVSPLKDMDVGTAFEPVLVDPDSILSPTSIDKVVFLSGKAYYDLYKERSARNLTNLALVRIEELCPFPVARLRQVVSAFANASSYVWFQEEPENMGAYAYAAPRIRNLLSNVELDYVGRKAAAAPATGIGSVHKAETLALLEKVLG